MPTPEPIFKVRGISAKGKTLPPEKIKLFSFECREMKINERRMKIIISEAEKYLDYEIPIIPLSSYRRYMHDGNRAEMQSYYSPRRVALLHLALAEAYERQGRFTNKLIDVIWAILEESTWLVSAHFRNFIGSEDGVPNYFGDVREHDISLYAAGTGALLSLVYRQCRDILDEVSPVICERIRYEVTKRIIKPYLNKTFTWMGFHFPNRSNWLTWITSNVLFTATVFADDLHIRERIVEKAMGSLDSFLSAYNADGGCDEGPSYWPAAAGALLECLDLIYDITGGAISIYDHPLIKAMGEYIVDFNIFGKTVVNFADAYGTLTPNAAQIRRYGEAVDSEVLRSFGEYLNKKSGGEMYMAHAYRSLRSLYEPDTEKPGEQISAKPAVYYECIKAAVIRESGVRGEGWCFAMKGGHNAENHNHNDVGSFIAFHDKTPLIVDIGAGQYINTNFENRDNAWHKESDFHSLPTFDGVYQKKGKQYASRDEVFSAEEKSYSVQLKDAYPEGTGIISYVRNVKIDGGITVTEDIELDAAREIVFNFTLPAKPEIVGDAFVINDGVRLSCSHPSELSFEEYDTTKASCRSWGDAIYIARFKIKSNGGKFIFTVK